MPGFVFKMQTLLNVKKQFEDNLKNELGKAIQKLEYEKAALLRYEKEMEDIIEEQNREVFSSIPVKKLREYSAYISMMKEKIETQKENVKFQQQNVDNYREQLIKAMQEKEILEKLKEKKYEQFLKQQLKNEQKINDEIVSYNYKCTR